MKTSESEIAENGAESVLHANRDTEKHLSINVCIYISISISTSSEAAAAACQWPFTFAEIFIYQCTSHLTHSHTRRHKSVECCLTFCWFNIGRSGDVLQFVDYECRTKHIQSECDWLFFLLRHRQIVQYTSAWPVYTWKLLSCTVCDVMQNGMQINSS